MPKPTFSWLVRYVDSGVFRVRTFQTEEAAEGFIRRIRDNPSQEFRSWAEVWTHERPPPPLVDQ
jgi:hypothetical protein